MQIREMRIRNKLGLHARAAAKLVHTAARFKSEVKVRKDTDEVDAKSILGILLLAAANGSTITVTANGEDESEALESIQSLIDGKFEEAE